MICIVFDVIFIVVVPKRVYRRVLHVRKRPDSCGGGPGKSPVLVFHHNLVLSPFLQLGNRMVAPGVPGNRKSLSPP